MPPGRRQTKKQNQNQGKTDKLRRQIPKQNLEDEAMRAAT